ncbi:unnamed protein product [Musa acuminata subsp. malaccensis]|uniref:(wild Malaysian banana) hypothetical protein n=1 Tax=Musa acuminata subsp. malaccensis TaxID=214687 RepID=A0A804IZ47_MUSAM|nr:PREDICTED: uncharacterized protein LOC103982089 [Musa acuminata subsp. malaccensis]CAG1844807.1 unnamed protein product [Musa acuminata subsp. malaccensis]
MGNCIDLQKPISWVDEEEWEAAELPSPAHCRKEEKTERVAAASANPPAKEELEEFLHWKNSICRKQGVASTEIKTRISKKQLEELLHQADEKGLPLKKILVDIATIGGVCTENRDRCWRPNLQSILEEVSELSRTP